MAELRNPPPGIMGWGEFSRWARDRWGMPLPPRPGPGPTYRAAWSQVGVAADRAQAGTGNGHPAEYGPPQRRRVACYARMAPMLSKNSLAHWLVLAAEHGDGYLMDDGSGVRWVPDLEPIQAAYVAGLAVAAMRCGE